MTEETVVQRECHYFRSRSETLFAWLHRCELKENDRGVAIICNPVGVEYMSGHRSIRHLADQLARDGIPALRFDYACTGDSSGGCFSDDFLSQIVSDIVAATRTAATLTTQTGVFLLGIGLGATFAAVAAQEISVSRLVLWNPTVNGKRFVREQKLLAQVLHQEENADSRNIDSAGIYLTPELQRSFQSINLGELEYENVQSVLLISRSDMKPSRQLMNTLKAVDIQVESVSLRGYKEMMDSPTDTVVPHEAIGHISRWLSSAQPQSTNSGKVRFSNDVSSRVNIPAGYYGDVDLQESALWFGAEHHLFGIRTLAETNFRTSKRAFLFLNCGSEHHVGPHRIYTDLARRCASLGHISFRFDIEGIGDSVSIGNNIDNNSYSPVAVRDIQAALTCLQAEYDINEFILSGICAGAYHSFKAIAALDSYPIVEANLINPLVFLWNYDDPDDHLQLDAHTYRSSIRDPRNWIRLLSGDINYKRLVRSIGSYIRLYSEEFYKRISHTPSNKALTGVPHDLSAIIKNDRRLTIMLSEGDPGFDILKLQAGRQTVAALASGHLEVKKITNANHGLSNRHMQTQLIELFMRKY